MEILVNDLDRDSSPQKIASIRDKFMERLTARAHATWDQTSQAFSQFLSKYDQAGYEETMSLTSQRSANVKKAFSMRESFEFKIQQAQDRCDKDAEWAAYTEYLAWEIRMKGIFSKDLINGLYERATTRFSTDANIWVDYVEFLIESPVKDIPTLSVLERATRHCPWSGDLWSHRILAMESEGKSFEEVEEVKHKATASGLVDINGLEDLMKVYIAWCGYLRRRAFAPGASEDELDVAEMGIRSSIEHVMQAGQKKYGNEFKGDPQYRLERIHIKFQNQRNGIESCRALWNDLIPRAGDSYDFWYRYYIWAMIIWSRITLTPEGVHAPPKDATQVLEMALQRIDTMDWPEQLLPMYLNHCEQHESVQVYREALIEVRRATKRIEERREKEKSAWNEQQAAQVVPEPEQTGKRKRNNESVADEQQPKKLKADEDDKMAIDEPAAADSSMQPKRDRENTTIVVRNLPSDVMQKKVRQFFRDCGTVNDVHIYEERGNHIAMVEFETKEDALFAQAKVTKPFDGQTISIEFSTGSTMWVTNYPPTADAKYIRTLFEKVSSSRSLNPIKLLISKQFGEVVDVRFPSLQGNTHRRFCYVQFLSPASAQKATELDGQILDKQYHLQAKISDPSKKADRHGAMYEGREVFIRNLHFGASEPDVRELFSHYGTIEKVRIPTRVDGKSKGVGFVAFENKVCLIPVLPFC
jgi:RNA recognition motif-containing protein